MQSCGLVSVGANLSESISGLCGLGLGSGLPWTQEKVFMQTHLLL